MSRLRPAARWALGLGLFGLAERVGLLFAYQPIPYGDTGSYLRLAGVLSRLTLNGYDGTRVPGYPAFLALVGLDPARAWLAQMAMGWAISLLLFWTTFRLTGSPALGVVVGGLYDLIPGQFLFEAALLTETLSTFLVVLALALLAFLDLTRRPWSAAAVASGVGLAASLAGLVRPLFYFLPVWLLPFVWLAGSGLRRRVAQAAAACLAPLLLLGGWIGFIDASYGFLAPTAMGGFSLVQHTGAFFEYLPDSAAPIRDTYIKYRNARLAERGDQTNTIWDAIPEMSRVSGLSFYDLSREVGRLSLLLIREHPALYLKSVLKGWVDFWKAPVYWQPESMRPAAVRQAMGGLALAGRGLCLAANAAFLVLSAAALVSQRARRALGVDRHLVAAAGAVWLTSVLQTLADHGDNPRFLVPLQMVVIYAVARAAYAFLTRARAREAQPA